mmetsp:Transcript_42474/g.99709  ORF Transcript_42474/g.99709 Transcript_42474/m.99709 type:complete len:261 (-) Transcript_42474:672-1454(-)
MRYVGGAKKVMDEIHIHGRLSQRYDAPCFTHTNSLCPRLRSSATLGPVARNRSTSYPPSIASCTACERFAWILIAPGVESSVLNGVLCAPRGPAATCTWLTFENFRNTVSCGTPVPLRFCRRADADVSRKEEAEPVLLSAGGEAVSLDRQRFPGSASFGMCKTMSESECHETAPSSTISTVADENDAPRTSTRPCEILALKSEVCRSVAITCISNPAILSPAAKLTAPSTTRSDRSWVLPTTVVAGNGVPSATSRTAEMT